MFTAKPKVQEGIGNNVKFSIMFEFRNVVTMKFYKLFHRTE